MSLAWDHAEQIADRFDLRPEDVHWALTDVIEHLRDYPKNQGRKYADLVTQAAGLLTEWLEHADRWAVDVLDPTDVSEFVRGRAPGCTWVVLQAKIRSLTPRDRLEAGLRLIGQWLDAQVERRAGIAELHRWLDEMEANDGD